MAEKMVRTQVYLPSEAYRELKLRARKQGMPLGVQIRDALVDYLFRLNPRLEPEATLPPLEIDALRAVIALAQGQGTPDAAENHDQYIYDDPHRDHPAVSYPTETRSARPAGRTLREPPAQYRARRRTIRRSKGKKR